MLQRTILLAISISLIAVALLGFSPPAQNHLTDAQSNAASAAKDTGKAMASDKFQIDDHLKINGNQ